MDRFFDVHIKRYKNLLATFGQMRPSGELNKTAARKKPSRRCTGGAPKKHPAVSVLTPVLSGETMSINERLQASRLNDKRTLIGLACAIGFIVVIVLYYQTIGF
jgi:hypothetical protein